MRIFLLGNANRPGVQEEAERASSGARASPSKQVMKRMGRASNGSRLLAIGPLLGGLALLIAADRKDGPRLSEEERAILTWANEVRAKEKLPALAPQAQLITAARVHSANMAKQKTLAHELDGKNVERRVLDAGYDYAEVGEILGGGDGQVPEFFKLWLKSPVHRAQLFHDPFREVGVAVARDDKGQLYCTVVFGVQRKKQ
jgi:uncharacterized protein YkwD